MERTITHPDHTLDSIVGYRVRRTFPDTDREHVEVTRIMGACRYAEAVEAACEEREIPGQYAVVDSIYGCGCIGQG